MGEEHPMLLLGKHNVHLALFCTGQTHLESCIHFSVSQFPVAVDSLCAFLESTQEFFFFSLYFLAALGLHRGTRDLC